MFVEISLLCSASEAFCGYDCYEAKIIAKILRRRIERKIEVVLGEDQFGFEEEKELGMQLG